MKALVYTAPGKAGVTDLPTPEPAAGEVLLKVASCGICHTDIDVLHGRYGNSTYPLVPGHEYAGTVERVGASVSTVSVGDRVVVDPNLSCGRCRPCRRGLRNLCENLQAYGVTTHGGFAEYGVVGEAAVHRIDGMSFELAALAEPLACVLNGIDQIETAGAANALVFGAGPIGLLMALALRDAGIAEVTVADIDEARLDAVGSLGLDPILSPSAALSGRARGFDVVVDATGVPAVVQGLPGFAANGGSVLLFGVCPPTSTVELSPFDLFRRQIRLAGSHSLNHNIPEALAVLRRSEGTMGRLVSERLALPEIVPRLTGESGGGGGMKVQYAVS